MKSGASNASFTYTLFIRFAKDTNEFQAEHYIHLLILWPEVTRIPSFEQHPIWFSVFFSPIEWNWLLGMNMSRMQYPTCWLIGPQAIKSSLSECWGTIEEILEAFPWCISKSLFLSSTLHTQPHTNVLVFNMIDQMNWNDLDLKLIQLSL